MALVVRFILLPEQNVVAPEAVMDGLLGGAVTVIALSPALLEQLVVLLVIIKPYVPDVEGVKVGVFVPTAAPLSVQA